MCPNWCCGQVKVKGKPENIKKFCKLFIFKDEIDKEDLDKKRFFARSFINNYDWKEFRKEFLGLNEAEFFVDFAWSVTCCLIDGYPTKNKKENPEDFGNCVTLEWACKEYDVEVNIESEEDGMGFEETIKADKNGVDYDCKDMPTYKCYNCGNEQLIASPYDLSEVECYQCYTYSFVDKIKDMLEKKIENEKTK